MLHTTKYCRSLHAHISMGTTSDDRFMPTGYVQAFADMDGLILTEKLDGQNNCFNRNGVFARSHVSPTAHPWDKPMRERWELIRNDLGDLELFGENMFGQHSIGYKNLESYFYLFAVRIKDTWLSWDEVKFYADLFDFPTVPEIPIRFALKNFVQKSGDENIALDQWLTHNLKTSWSNSVETPGLLGGYDIDSGIDASEGFVIRNKGEYTTNGGILPVANNEFNNLFKLVRKSHVKTDVHWSKTWEKAKLVDYQKYQWHRYEYLGRDV